MNNNNTQKALIKVLTETHQNPKEAYLKALNLADTSEERDKIRKIAKAFKITL